VTARARARAAVSPFGVFSALSHRNPSHKFPAFSGRFIITLSYTRSVICLCKFHMLARCSNISRTIPKGIRFTRMAAYFPLPAEDNGSHEIYNAFTYAYIYIYIYIYTYIHTHTHTHTHTHVYFLLTFLFSVSEKSRRHSSSHLIAECLENHRAVHKIFMTHAAIHITIYIIMPISGFDRILFPKREIAFSKFKLKLNALISKCITK